MKRIHTAGISFILFILCILACGCTRGRAEESDEIQPIASTEPTVSDETDNSVEVITTQSLSGEVDESDVILRSMVTRQKARRRVGVAGRRNRGFLHDWIRSARWRNHRMQLCIEYISVRAERRRVPDSKGNRRQGLRRRIQNRGLKCESVPRHHRGQMATYTTRRCAQ